MGLSIYLIKEENPLIYIAILSLVAGNLIPYIRAKAESLNISCTVGIAERTERLGIALLAIGLAGLNVPFALAIGMWVLAIASTVTVLQRILVVRKGLLGR